MDIPKSTGIPENTSNNEIGNLIALWDCDLSSFASFVLWKIAEMESMDKLPTSRRNILLSPIAQLAIVIVADQLKSHWMLPFISFRCRGSSHGSFLSTETITLRFVIIIEIPRKECCFCQSYYYY